MGPNEYKLLPHYAFSSCTSCKDHIRKYTQYFNPFRNAYFGDDILPNENYGLTAAYHLFLGLHSLLCCEPYEGSFGS